MSNPNPNQSGLKKIKTTKEARKKGKAGGIKSGKVRKEKKLLSQIYGEILADKAGIDGNGKSVKDVIKEVLNGNPKIIPASSKVSMIKEIRESTEGSKLALTNSDGEDLFKNGITIGFESPKKKGSRGKDV